MGFFQRNKPTQHNKPTPPNRAPKQEPDGHQVLADCVQRHFEGASRVATPAGQPLLVDTGLRRAGDPDTVRIATDLNSISPMGPQYRTASTFFQVSGGPFGPEPIFASASGYGSSDPEAIIGGGCAWSCTFRPLARAACGLDLGPNAESVTEQVITRPDGARFRLLHDGWARVLSTGAAEHSPQDRIATVRGALRGAADGLSPIVAASELLPALPRDRVSLLSTFVMELPDQRVVEIKLHGQDLPPVAGVLFRREGGSLTGPDMVLLRELAVLIPIE